METITITGHCVFTGAEHSVTVPLAGYRRWQSGEMIQTAMPNVPIDDREFLISGISPAGWAEMRSFYAGR